MNTDSLWQSIQTGLRVSLGATATILETLQDPQKRQESLVTLQAELHDRVQEWVAKGEMTEQEARNFVDSILQQQGNKSATPAKNPEETGQTDAQQSLEELTDKIADLRSELENLRNTDHQ